MLHRRHADSQDVLPCLRRRDQPRVGLPAGLAGQPALGAFDAADPLVEVMNRKFLLMRRTHAQMREQIKRDAPCGIVKDGTGTTLCNDVTGFGLGQVSADFALGTAGRNVAPDRVTDFGAGRLVSDTAVVDLRVADLPTPRAPGDVIVRPARAVVVSGV